MRRGKKEFINSQFQTVEECFSDKRYISSGAKVEQERV